MLENQRKVQGRSFFQVRCLYQQHHDNNIFQDDPEKIIRNDKFEVVDSFHYLGDSIGQSGGCFDTTTESNLVTWSNLEERERVAWNNFHSLFPVLTKSGILLKVRGHAYNTCLRSVLPYARETQTWAVKVDDIHQLVRNDNAMVRWICSAKLCEKYLCLI